MLLCGNAIVLDDTRHGDNAMRHILTVSSGQTHPTGDPLSPWIAASDNGQISLGTEGLLVVDTRLLHDVHPSDGCMAVSQE